MSFLAELRRRRVVRVALVYAATAFVVLQAADLLATGLALPPWVFAAITVVTVLGFPLALVLAWAFQITPHGAQTGAGGDAERWLSRRTVAAVGVALLLVLAGGWFINPVVTARLGRAAADGDRTGPVIASLLPPPGETWQDGGTSFAVSPDGSKVAVVGFEGSGLRLSVRSLDRYTTTVLPTTLGAFLPFWSPDGRALGFFAEGELRVVELATGQVRTLCPAPSPRGGSWGADGVILYTSDPAGGLHRTSATGGPCEPVTFRDSEPSRPEPTAARRDPRTGRPYFLGDGRHFVLAAGFASWLGRIGDESLVLLERREDANRSVVAAPDHLLFRTADGALYAQRIDVRRRRMSGTPRRLLDDVISPQGYTAVSTSANGVMVVQGPGSTSFRMLQWTDRSGQVLDSLVVPQPFWVARPSTRGDRVALGGWQFGLHDRTRGVTTVHRRAVRNPLGAPVWAPGDTLLAFRGGDDDSLAVQVLDPRTGATRALGLPAELRYARPLDWSRDGRLLALALRPPGDRTTVEAWAYDVVTGEGRRLFEDPGNVTQIRFSPDGRWLAWHSVARGYGDVYVRPLHGEGAPLRISPDGGAEPRWSADGRELYFWRPGTTALMVVTVRPDVSPAFSAPRLFRVLPSPALSDYEPTADGGLALFVVGGEQPGYTLILDWMKLLEREERPR
jgi:eukaryotic-like serine/threonine-protein kinase